MGGGHVGRHDVAVRGGRIAAVAPALPRESAREVVDVTGHLVTPGLVDLHTHVHPGATYWGIHPDPVAWHSGVTTWVDAGSAGAWGIDALRAAVASYRVRVPALLNISGLGLTGRTGESTDLAHVDVDAARDAIARHPDFVVGVKVRIDRETVGANGLRPLERALAVGPPVMVHVAAGPPAPKTCSRCCGPATSSPTARAALDRRDKALRDLLGQPLVGPEGLTEQFPRTQFPPTRKEG